jgi:hypothetical protein
MESASSVCARFAGALLWGILGFYVGIWILKTFVAPG